MRRLWLVFCQAVTCLLAAYFVVLTLRPQWLNASVWQPVAPAATPQEQGASLRGPAQRAAPAVVSISTQSAQAQGADPWYRYHFGAPEGEQPSGGVGSGVIVNAAGFVLTNNHVVEGGQDIEVQLADGRRANAKVLGTDPETDLAVLKIQMSRLPVIELGDSNTLAVGDTVLAIGNPFGMGQTVTSGIVSALGRTRLGINTFENFIQTDAAINPGNSGGALVNTHGQLVGINTAIYSRSGGSLGIGFAIPTPLVSKVLNDIVRDGSVTRGWLGVEPRALPAEVAKTFGLQPNGGVVIAGVLRDGPAAQAGMRPGDVVTDIAQQPVGSVEALLAVVAALKPGQATTLSIRRAGSAMQLTVVPGRRPTPTRR